MNVNESFDINAWGTVNVLECLRGKSKKAAFIVQQHKKRENSHKKMLTHSATSPDAWHRGVPNGLIKRA
ncbi:MAG: hypothetical protein L6416_04035 [Candidatus Omnitrophica bacterium]|nr:hypothetical protein [Candidatus Omnitrophota bacterium]